MSNYINYSNNVVYTLKAPGMKSLDIEEPEGWLEDRYSLKRDESLHGFFKNKTNTLGFKYKASVYIEKAFEINGHNCRTILTRRTLKEINGELKFSIDYIAFADYDTAKEKEGIYTIDFKFNNLNKLLETYDDTEFEVGVDSSVDDEPITDLEYYLTEIKDRKILQTGASILNSESDNVYRSSAFYKHLTPLTELLSRGPDRHSSVDIENYSVLSGYGESVSASNMFFVNDVSDNGIISLKVKIDLKASVGEGVLVQGSSGDDILISVIVWDYDENSGEFNINSFNNIFEIVEGGLLTTYNIEESIEFNFDLEFNQGLTLSYITEDSREWVIEKQNINISVDYFYENSQDIKFMFVHDVFDRFLEIITGVKGRFESKYFGRIEKDYVQDGEGGLIGIVWGLWARAFNEASDKYKSLTTKIKDIKSSCHNVFNVGFGIQIRNGIEKLRCEELDFFYQNRVGITLPFQITEVERSNDKNIFISEITMGYKKGGDYEDEMGLDEPNVETTRISPLKYTENKFNKVSEIRSDEYGLKQARIKPELNFPNEDTKYDDSNWFLDLKRTESDKFTQKDWDDRLQQLPEGIHSPETFRSAFFTPIQILKRHSYIFKSGLSSYYTRFIKYVSSKSNSTLKTWFIGESQAYTENDDILISDLKRALFEPKIIKFKHPMSLSLWDEINSTKKIYYKGSEEDVPMVYFKIKFLNENDEWEKGYLMELDPDNDAQFTVLKSNEKLIR